MVIESNSQFDLINSVNIYKHPKILQIRYITLFLTFIEECSSYLRNIDVSKNGEDKKKSVSLRPFIFGQYLFFFTFPIYLHKMKERPRRRKVREQTRSKRLLCEISEAPNLFSVRHNLTRSV